MLLKTAPLLIAIAALAACGVPSTTDVVVTQFKFDPELVTVDVGTEVTWTNFDEIEHTVTAGTPEDPETGAFDHTFSATPGGTFTFAFDRAGQQPYFCSRHPFMRGLIDVT